MLEAALGGEGIADRIAVVASTGRDRRDDGPAPNVTPGPTIDNTLSADAIEAIVQEHPEGGHPVNRWLFRPTVTPGGRRRGELKIHAP